MCTQTVIHVWALVRCDVISLVAALSWLYFTIDAPISLQGAHIVAVRADTMF